MSDIIKLLLKDKLTEFVSALQESGAGVTFVEPEFDDNDPLQTEHRRTLDTEDIAEFIHDYVVEQEFKSCYGCHHTEICVVYHQTFLGGGLGKLCCSMKLEVGEAVRHIMAHAIGSRCRHYMLCQDSDDAS